MRRLRLWTGLGALVMVLAVGAGTALAQTTTMTATANGPNGAHDDWNLAANWDNGVPSGAIEAIVSAGLYAEAWNAATPVYDGPLTLQTGSTLQMGWTTNYPESFNALGGASVTLNNGSAIRLRLPSPNPLELPDITMAGDASIHLSPSTSAHHRTRIVDDVTGTGALTVIGNNNNTLHMDVGNPGWSGDFIANAEDGWRVEANASGAFGTGDVTINARPANDRGATLQIDASDVIADTAALFLNGPGDQSKPSKLILNAGDTVAEFWIDGVNQGSGSFTIATHPGVISGTGTLIVPAGPDTRPPLPDPMTFSVVPHGATTTSIAMAATQGLDISTPIEYQFRRDSSVLSGWQPGLAYTDTGLTPALSYDYEVRARDAVGNIGGWSAVFSTTPIVENVMIADAGGNDSWLVNANWSAGAPPSGSESAIISDGLSARISGTPTPYAGNLDLGVGAELYIFGDPGKAVIPTAPAKATLRDGSLIVLRTSNSGFVTFPDVEMLGDAAIKGGQSTSGHHTSRHFDGVISGPGELTLDGVNNNTFKLNAANTFDGLIALSTQNQGFRVEANATGSLGIGDVTVENAATLIINAADAMDDLATLFLNDAKDSRRDSKLIMNADDTIMAFFLDGIDLGTGTFDQYSGLLDSAGTPLITGSGILTVTGPLGPVIIPEPSALLIWSLGLLGLAAYARRRKK